MGAHSVFSDFLAARVHELTRELANSRSETARVRRSRDLWKQRASELSSGMNGNRPTGVTILNGPKRMADGTSAYRNRP